MSARNHAKGACRFAKYVSVFLVCLVYIAFAGNTRAHAVEVESELTPFLEFLVTNADGATPSQPDDLLFDIVDGKPVLAPDGHQLTFGEYEAVRGTVTMECVEGGTQVTFDLKGLIPNGVYSVWVDIYKAPGFTLDFANEVAIGALGPPDGSEADFTASATGEAIHSAIMPTGPLSMFGELNGCLTDEFEVLMTLAYHFDGQAHGPIPGLETTFPESGFPDGTWTEHGFFDYKSHIPPKPLPPGDLFVAPGDPIPGNASGTVVLLAGEHTTNATVEITTPMILTAQPGAVWTSSADPAIAIHANNVSIRNLTLKSATPTATAIVSGSPVTLEKPSHHVTIESNTIEGFISGILHVYGDGLVVRNNTITGSEVAAVGPLDVDAMGVLSTMARDTIIEGNHIQGFLDGIFASGSHGRAQGNTIRRTNQGIILCTWIFPVVGEPDMLPELIPNVPANYWDINSNDISDGIQFADYFGVQLDIAGVVLIDGAHHNLVHGNRISGAQQDIYILGELTALSAVDIVLPPSFENVVVANPGEVLENLPGDPNPSTGNVLVGIEPIDEAGMTLYQEVIQNVGPRTEPTPEDFSRVFFTSLSAGLNMIDVPLQPSIPYTAKSLIEELGATMVIRLDAERQRFEGFTISDASIGFPIEGGQGYIVNVPQAKDVAFVGAAWTNAPTVEAAPAATPRTSAWAFVVSGKSLDIPEGVISIRNLRTGAVATSPVDASTGDFSVAWADLSRQAVIQAGDRLELSFTDTSGRLIGRIHRQLGIDHIQDAYVHVTLRRADILPTQTQLMQNYPNPFNPETWIPYQLEKSTTVSIAIYDGRGGLVRTLDLGHRAAGFYQSRAEAAYWDGKNQAGESVASGVYFYQLRAGDFSATRRMLIVK